MDAVKPPHACDKRSAGTATSGSKPIIIKTGASIVPYPMPSDESINSQTNAKAIRRRNKPYVKSNNAYSFSPD